MATHIAWGGNEDLISPVPSSTPSIVPIDSAFSHERNTSSTVQEATGPSTHESFAKLMSFLLAEPSGGETSASKHQRADTADDSFTRHHKYFFKDGNITFLVDGTLYCVHRYFFSRDSVYFSTRFDQLGIRDHEVLPIAISLSNIERKDLDAFLSILYPENFEQHALSYDEWKSVLHLSTRWDFVSIRMLALNNIQPPTPHDRLLLARTYSVDHWVIPALSALCERRAPLNLDEAHQMNIEDVVLVATVREDIRTHVLQVDATEIPRRVEAAQAGKSQLSTSARKMSSEERFIASSAGRSASASSGPLGSRPPAIVHTKSQSGSSEHGANDSDLSSAVDNSSHIIPVSAMGSLLESVPTLAVSANRWVASSTRRSGSGVDSESPEIVERKVKGLLNKLTMERFDSISDQIIAWANKLEREKDGRTLIQVIKLVFEKATDEATFSEMYARLCRKMMEKISPKVQDDGIKNTEGKPFAGGQLFRKCLLNRCQEDFERGWVAKETTAALAATKATEDKAVKEANEKAKGGEESELYSDEYHAAAKAKRRGLGFIRFIGELFKLQMLTERIMHEYIKKLLGNIENPEEEEIESLCKLLTTVGSLLDTRKARAHLDVYFSRMRELTKNKNVNARMRFVIQDVIELRERKWVPRNAVAAPTTIAQVHESVNMRQNSNRMSRGGARQRRRGGNRNTAEVSHPVGWSVAGTGAPPCRQPKVDDLSQFGKISKTTPITFRLLAASDDGSGDEVAEETGALTSAVMSEAEVKAKIEEDVKKFFGIRMLDKAESYFSTLPTEHRYWLVDALVMKSIEMKEQDVTLVGDLFVRVREKGLCSPGVFEDGFNRLVEALDDLEVDIPKTWPYFAILLRSSGLDQDKERSRRIDEKIMNTYKVL